jgi:D-galactarolactone cycloisomerase
MHDRPMVLVRIRDHEGRTGWGEIWCNYPTCGAEHRARLATEVVAPLLLGRSVRTPQAVWRDLVAQTEVLAIQCGERGPVAQVLAGIDIALWDLIARRAETPLWRLLGGSSPVIETYASGLNPDEPQIAAQQAWERGYRAFKLKVGFEERRDERNLRNLRKQLAAFTPLMVDANQAWDLNGSLHAVRYLERYDLAWIEEPLRADRPLWEWKALAAATSIPLAAGENMTSRAEFDAAIESSTIGVLQPDVAKWGGFSGCLPVAKATLAAKRRYCPHYLGGGIGLLASAHLLAATGGDGLLEIDVNENPLRDRLAGPVANVTEGRATLTESHGLGTEPDIGLLSDFAVVQHVAG